MNDTVLLCRWIKRKIEDSPHIIKQLVQRCVFFTFLPHVSYYHRDPKMLCSRMRKRFVQFFPRTLVGGMAFLSVNVSSQNMFTVTVFMLMLFFNHRVSVQNNIWSYSDGGTQQSPVTCHQLRFFWVFFTTFQMLRNFKWAATIKNVLRSLWRLLYLSASTISSMYLGYSLIICLVNWDILWNISPEHNVYNY